MEAGLKIEEFLRLSWREFVLYRKGYEARDKRLWMHTRMVGYMTYLNIVKHEKTRKTIDQWFPLDGNEIHDSPKLTTEEFQMAQRKLYQVLKQRNGRANP